MTILKRIFLSLLLFAGCCLQPVVAIAEHPITDKPLLSDIPHLQTILREEMRALQQAMSKIVNALPTGDWPTVTNTAQAIHDSFILQQKLTEQDRERLRHLPTEFVRIDQAFHQQAIKLREAAAAKDAELSVFYVSRMLDKCMQCHARFAAQRFPGLQSSEKHTPHH